MADAAGSGLSQGLESGRARGVDECIRWGESQWPMQLHAGADSGGFKRLQLCTAHSEFRASFTSASCKDTHLLNCTVQAHAADDTWNYRLNALVPASVSGGGTADSARQPGRKPSAQALTARHGHRRH